MTEFYNFFLNPDWGLIFVSFSKTSVKLQAKNRKSKLYSLNNSNSILKFFYYEKRRKLPAQLNICLEKKGLIIFKAF